MKDQASDMPNSAIGNAIEATGRGLSLGVHVKLPKGLHARPSARLAQLAQSFKCDISLISENGEADAKSMLDVLSLAVPPNAKIILLARGEGAAGALVELAEFLTRARE